MASNKKIEINQSPEHSTAHASSGDSRPLIEDGQAGRWANLAPKLKKAIVIGVVVGVILLIALIVLIVVLTGNRCSFSSSLPSYLTHRSVYTKPDVTNLARFAGYMHVYDLGFLALDIKRMTMNYLDNFINIADDCVTLSIGFTNMSDEPNVPTIIMYELKWSFNNLANYVGERQPYESCTVNVPNFYHSFKQDHCYSCLERKVHKCYKNGPDGKSIAIAELVIESFELELKGDKEIIYQGNFSKPPDSGSCDSYTATFSGNSTTGRPLGATVEPAHKN